MDVSDLLTLFRSRVDDTAEPYFWSDTEFFVYLTDAANQYCRYGRPIADHTSALAKVNYEANDPWITYDERILKVVSAYDENNNNKTLEIVDWEETKESYPDEVGSITRMILGMEESRIRVDSIPIVNGVISMVIHRLPLKSITEQNPKFEGVRIVDRLSLLDWVIYRCYGHEDSEMFNPEKSAAGYRAFMGDMSKVRSDDMKRSNKPRSARYGGI